MKEDSIFMQCQILLQTVSSIREMVDNKNQIG